MIEQCHVVVFIVDDLGFRGPGTPDSLTELCQPQNTANMLGHLTKSMCDTSTRSICRAIVRVHCFGKENSLSFVANSRSSARNLVSSLWHTHIKG